MGQDHEHDADEHYHGEPSRVLNDRPLPTTVALYPGTPVEGWFSPETPVRESDVHFWSRVFQSVGHVETILSPTPSPEPSSEGPTVETIDFFDSQGTLTWPEAVRSTDSILFVPARLRMEERGWTDLTKNDVTVNWVAVDADRLEGDTPRALVLSDWLVSIADDIPVGRSAGSIPGIVHLRRGSLDDILIEFHQQGSLWEAVNAVLDDPTVKFRPGFIRDVNWSFETS